MTATMHHGINGIRVLDRVSLEDDLIFHLSGYLYLSHKGRAPDE